MIYLDTSVLVPMIVPEASSSAVRRWRDTLTEAQAKTLTLSAWVVTEFTGAIALKVRNRQLTKAQGEAAVSLLHEEIAPKLDVVEVTPTDFRLADVMLREFALGLRAGDALHLAVASRSKATQFVCLDRQLARAGTALGIAATIPGEAGRYSDS